MTGPAPGLVAEVTHLVGEDDTATAMGSGDVPVLATPRLLALAEAATVAAVAGTVSSERTSVGTRVELEHLAASPVGVRVSVRAELVGVDGRLLRFEIVATYIGMQALVINYRNHRGQLVNEVLIFDGELVREGHGTYLD